MSGIILYPPEVVTTLTELMQFEWQAGSRRLLPDHPVYSILAGRHSSKLRGRGLDFEEVRRYIPGDDIRTIDWRVTSRTGLTHVKVYDEEKERPVFLIVDQSSRMFFGSQHFLKSVVAAHAAALAGFYTLKRGDRVGGIVFGDQGLDHIPPRRSREALLYYLQAVVKWNSMLPQRLVIPGEQGLLNRVLREAAAITPHDHVITLIGDCSVLDGESRQLLETMNVHNDIVLIHIYDPFEADLPSGRLMLTDGRQQISWDNGRRDAGEGWRQHFLLIKQSLISAFANTRIPIVFFDTASPVGDQVLEHLKQ